MSGKLLKDILSINNLKYNINTYIIKEAKLCQAQRAVA